MIENVFGLIQYKYPELSLSFQINIPTYKSHYLEYLILVYSFNVSI